MGRRLGTEIDDHVRELRVASVLLDDEKRRGLLPALVAAGCLGRVETGRVHEVGCDGVRSWAVVAGAHDPVLAAGLDAGQRAVAPHDETVGHDLALSDR